MVTVKRFDMFGRKISRSLQYPAAFNLKQFTSTAIDKKVNESEVPNMIYDLYGVVIHQGATTNSGHYYAYCKSTSGKWYDCNDSFIGPISEQHALNKQAYMLFYQKRATAPPKPVPEVKKTLVVENEKVKKEIPAQSLGIEEIKHSGSSTADTQRS